ncbi:MAG: APC family permease [Phycisphaerae bacterium]
MVCVGVGAAIGSGVFRTPGDVAALIHSPWWILVIWLVAGLITLMQSLVTAELATRFPRAGGEYQFLKEAYGEFAAFFFGWSVTVFIIGGGAATIAAALGDFAVELFDVRRPGGSAAFGCAAIAAVVVVNALGLRSGALAQNCLSMLKVAALALVAGGAILVSGRIWPAPAPIEATPAAPLSLNTLLLALLPAFWSYAGVTDAAKLAEETRDVRRALPRALVATVAIMTLVYVFYNYALLCAMSPNEMAGRAGVHAAVFEGVAGTGIAASLLVISILVCLGSISSVFLANVRVTFALARDGLTFRRLARMSAGQAPIGSLLVCAAVAVSFLLVRGFEQILRIYFMASTILFGLTYASLIVFRLRDRRAGRAFPAAAYRAPAGVLQAVALVLLEIAIAVSIIAGDVRTWTDPDTPNTYDSLTTLALLVAMALLYRLWKGSNRDTNDGPQGRARIN